MPKQVALGEVLQHKRERKPKVPFVPDTTATYARKPTHNSTHHDSESSTKDRRGRPKRTRNEAKDATIVNKWKNYLSVVKKALSYISRSMHYLEVLTGDKNLSIDQIRPNASNGFGLSSHVNGLNDQGKLEHKILQAKQLIVTTLQTVEQENHQDKQWYELEQEDEDGMVDLSNIMCSKCLGEEYEGNDILICDRKGCLRAYHQNCLDPPMKLPISNDEDGNENNADEKEDQELLNPEHDWFCWRCECIDDCLDVIGERCGIEYDNVSDLFPELHEKSGQENTLAYALLDEDDEEDADYDGNEGDDLEEDEDEDDDEDDEDDQDEGDGEVIINAEEVDDGEVDDDEDEDDEDDRAGSEFDSAEDDSEIDEDELAGLLEDAEADANVATLTSSSGARSLRPRRGNANASEQDVFVHCDEQDVGLEVAKVKRGVVKVGKVVEVHKTSGDEVLWIVQFEDEGIQEYDTKATILEAAKLFRDYQKRSTQTQADSSLRNQIQNLLDDKGKISEENVMNHKRERKGIDYVALSMELFGTLEDEDADGQEFMWNPKGKTNGGEGSRKKKSKLNMDDISDLEEINEDIDEEYDEKGSKRKKRKHAEHKLEKKQKEKKVKKQSNSDNEVESLNQEEEKVPKKRGRKVGTKMIRGEDGKLQAEGSKKREKSENDGPKKRGRKAGTKIIKDSNGKTRVISHDLINQDIQDNGSESTVEQRNHEYHDSDEN